jgi:LCP family protein required for cell wall assembly
VKKGIKHSPTSFGLQSSESEANSQSGFESNSVNDVFTASPTPVEENEPRGGSGLTRWFYWSAAFALTAAVSAMLGATLALITPLSPVIVPHLGGGVEGKPWRKNFQYRLARPVHILVMGIDRVLDTPESSPDVFAGRSDTMLLLRLDPKDNSVNMLSIPRDTQVEIPGYGVTKINQANEEGGPELAARVTSRTLNNVPVDRYVRVTTDAFRELVDLVGGVEVYVPQQMQYEDATQHLKIDLEPGWQTLTGDQAEQFARFRSDNKGDIGRVQRQQVLLKALRQRIQSPAVLPRLPEAVRVMQQYIDTNLSLEEMLALVSFSLELDQDDFHMVLLPGRFSQPDEFVASYWLMNSQGRDRIMRQYFQQDIQQNSLYASPVRGRLRVAVQNATGETGVGDRVARYLREKGLENVYVIENWSDSRAETEIIAQQGDLETAATVKRLLGLGKVEASSTGDLDSDLTIRVGEDWLEKEF